MGYDPGVYNRLPGHYGAHRRIPNVTSAANTSQVEPLGGSYRQPNLSLLSSEHTRLLPYTVNHHTIRYGAAKTPKARSTHWLRYLGVFIYWVFLGALIAGLGYGIYAGAKWALPLWRDTIWPAVIRFWQKVVHFFKSMRSPT